MPREIQAALSPGPGQPWRIETLILDDPGPHEVILQVMAASICHTDLGIADFLSGKHVFGHEGAGVVVEVGSAVEGLKPGDRVVATFGSCGTCPNCLRNTPAYCYDHLAINLEGKRLDSDSPTLCLPSGEAVGGAFFQQSCFADHAIATDRNVVKIPDWLDFSVAAPLGCGIQTGAGAVMNCLNAQAARPIAVFGVGAVGLSAVMAAAILGCAPIIAVDIRPERLALARELGAHHVIDARSDPSGEIRRHAPGGCSYSLDTAGLQSTFEAALEVLHPGGACGVVTTPGAWGDPVPHPGGARFVSTHLIGVIEGNSVPDTFIPDLIEHHRSGRLPYDRLLTRYPFHDLNRALKDARSGAAIKPVLEF
ncbi:MAG: NAD(P)-dependent alcohol dehydrogenase [Chromatocurvus sp.]